MAALKSELAPRGVLRVGLNMSNFLLVSGNPQGGAPTGIVPDLSAEIASRLGVPLAWVPYPDAGLLSNGANEDAWDIAFMGAEPERARVISFTAAYLEIEATYLVTAGSTLQSIAEVDRPGVRIAVAARAAYALYLGRTLKQAVLVEAEGLGGSFELFVNGKLDALAGLKPRLMQDQEKIPGSRILPGRFTAIQQAIATPSNRPNAFVFLKAYAEEIKSNGTVARLIAKHGVKGVSVPAPAGGIA